MKYAPRATLTPAAAAICAQLRAEIVRIGWSETALLADVDRSALHRAFRADPAKCRPNFVTVAAVAQAVGLEFKVSARSGR